MTVSLRGRPGKPLGPASPDSTAGLSPGLTLLAPVECTGRPRAEAVFTTTHWSLVLNAGAAASPESEQALGRLCEVYWFPLYSYVRRKGHSPEEAQDLTQEFFARLLAGNYLRTLDRTKGRFRSFLLAALEHFLAKQWRDSRRLKRGGGRSLLSLEETDAERRYSIEPVETMTAEKIYERRWAFTLLKRALGRLRDEFAAAGKLPLFEALQGQLTGGERQGTYAELGPRLGLSEGALKVAVHRLRGRYGELVRDEIAQTVARPEQVEEELRCLWEAITA